MAHTTTTGGGKTAVLLTVVVVKTVRTDSLPVEKAFLSCGVICLQNSTTSATVIERRWRRVRGRGGGGGGGGGNVGPLLKRLVIAPFRFGIKAVRRGGDVHNDLVDFVTNGTYQSKVPGVINYVLGNETDWRSAEGQKTPETTAAPLAKGKVQGLAAKLFPLRQRKNKAEKSTPKEKGKATGGKKEGVMDTLIDMTF